MLKFLLCFLFIQFAFANEQLLDGRIIGGVDASIYDFPYQVSVEYLFSHRCGGAIIARTWVLTSAHCVDGLSEFYFNIRAGTSYRQTGGQVINVETVIPHSNYSTTTYDFDIALLQLSHPLNLTTSVQIARLPDNAEVNIEGALGNVTGWGSTVEGGSGSTILHVIEIPILSQLLCQDLYSSYLVTERMFCAGLWEGGKDACAGDGGSPLVVNGAVTGLVSWGIGCARPQQPGVYANVAALRDWITEQTGI